MKSVLSLIAAALLGAPSAQALTCQAQMIHSICGTGIVEVMVVESVSNHSFKILNGDVGCWNMEQIVDGEVKNEGAKHTYFDTVAYKLLITDPSTNLKSDYGYLYYDKTQNKARLILNSQPSGVLSTKYDLDCR